MSEERQNSSFLRGALSLGAGSAAGQFIVLAATPALTRMYAPEAYGSLGLVATISTLFFVGASGRYETAIVLPRRVDTSRLLLQLALTLVACTTFIALVAVLTLRRVAAESFNDPSLVGLLWWLPISVGAMGVCNVFGFWLVRHTRFRGIAGARVSRSAATVTAQLGIGITGGRGFGLVAGQSVGQVAAAGVLWFVTRRIGRGYGRLRRTVRRFIVVAHRYRDFPRFSVPQAILDAGSQQLPVFVLGSMFGPGPVGLFWFTNRLLQLATELFGQSVRQVFHQQLAERVRSRQPVGRFFWQVTAGLFGFAAMPAVALVFFGPELFSLVFGVEWLEAGGYARWLALSWVVSMMLQPSVAMIFTLELQRGQLMSEVLLLIGRMAGMLVGARLAGAVGVVAGFAVATAVAGTLLVIWVALMAQSVDRRFAATALERGGGKRGA